MSTPWDKAINNVKGTYQILKEKYGICGKDWDLMMQSTDGEFDDMQIRLADGTVITERIKLETPL